MSIHPTAIIEPGAVIGADCEIHAHAVITRFAILGDRVTVHPGSVVGGDPQYLKFEKHADSYVRVGNGTTIRENCTLNRAVARGASTVVGENCYLMACAHVAHDCQVGDSVVLANNALLAGHVAIGNSAFVGGAAAIHQNVRVGESVMIGGLSRITRDLAPYTMVAERDEVSGLNLLGLKRRAFPRETVAEIKRAFREVYLAGGNPRARAEAAIAANTYQSQEARNFLAFFLEGKRGFARSSRHGATLDE